MIERDAHGNPVITYSGIRCGNHDGGASAGIRHANIASVWECFRISQEKRESSRCECGTPDTEVCPETCPERIAEARQEAFANRD